MALDISFFSLIIPSRRDPHRPLQRTSNNAGIIGQPYGGRRVHQMREFFALFVDLFGALFSPIHDRGGRVWHRDDPSKADLVSRKSQSGPLRRRTRIHILLDLYKVYTERGLMDRTEETTRRHAGIGRGALFGGYSLYSAAAANGSAASFCW